MATLNKREKIFIVRLLAEFNTPTETVELVKQEFKKDVTRQQVESYDPTKRAGRNLSAELKAEFEATRKAFVDQPLNIPIANLSVRLMHLQRIVDHAGKNKPLIKEALEQAAKEMGGVYTNRKEVTGKGGGPIETVSGMVPVEQYLQAREQIKDEY
jgi:hypothetical protein